MGTIAKGITAPDIEKARIVSHSFLSEIWKHKTVSNAHKIFPNLQLLFCQTTKAVLLMARLLYNNNNIEAYPTPLPRSLAIELNMVLLLTITKNLPTLFSFLTHLVLPRNGTVFLQTIVQPVNQSRFSMAISP